MNKPEIYHRTNFVQRQVIKALMEEYQDKIQWRPDGRDTLLDVGSGSGNVLMECVYPLMPRDFEQVVLSDISEKMINYARATYSDYARTKFIVLDIATDILPKELCGGFDHVTSFYCLMWVPNQLKALQNIYKMLHNCGDVLLQFLVQSTVYDVFTILSRTTKWSQYMWECEQFLPPLHDSVDPVAEYKQYLHQAGFSSIDIQLRDGVYYYDGASTYRDFMKSVYPYLDRIPIDLQDEFFDDVLNTTTELNSNQSPEGSTGFRFEIQAKYLVVYARKTVSISKGDH